MFTSLHKIEFVSVDKRGIYFLIDLCPPMQGSNPVILDPRIKCLCPLDGLTYLAPDKKFFLIYQPRVDSFFNKPIGEIDYYALTWDNPVRRSEAFHVADVIVISTSRFQI